MSWGVLQYPLICQGKFFFLGKIKKIPGGFEEVKSTATLKIGVSNFMFSLDKVCLRKSFDMVMLYKIKRKDRKMSKIGILIILQF